MRISANRSCRSRANYPHAALAVAVRNLTLNLPANSRAEVEREQEESPVWVFWRDFYRTRV